jgi:hypothetical protein
MKRMTARIFSIAWCYWNKPGMARGRQCIRNMLRMKDLLALVSLRCWDELSGDSRHTASGTKLRAQHIMRIGKKDTFDVRMVIDLAAKGRAASSQWSVRSKRGLSPRRG